MSLRRWAQSNNAVNASPSPATAPSTPRNRVPINLYRSPASTPSISSSVPFDWDAARSRRPPPYGTPLQNKTRKSIGVNGSALGTPVKRIVRKKGWLERITSIPSTIAFELALFPHNIPLPPPNTLGRLIGGILHLFHLWVRVSQVRKVPDSDLGWEDMYREDEGSSWFDWTALPTTLLVVTACLNAIYLFTRIKLYRLHQQREPVSSPNARFVSAQLDFEPLAPRPVFRRAASAAWYAFVYSWQVFFGMNSSTRSGQTGGRISRVQQLEVWAPGQLETGIFTVYSPVHAFLWMSTGSSNWISMIFIMGLASIQLHALCYGYNVLLKDKEIIAAEVMNEYNSGFVYPRVNPIRKDAAVMTHEAEIVDIWSKVDNTAT